MTGDPPPELAEIRERRFREQKQEEEEEGDERMRVDFIHEIPIEVAKAACGYRADEVEDSFWALATPRPQRTPEAPRERRKGGFLARLFGRN